MTQLRRKSVRVRRIIERVAVFRRSFKLIWERILVCSCSTRMSNNARYIKLSPQQNHLSPSMETISESSNTTPSCSDYDSDSGLVSLKICILGDRQIGKTSFLLKYVGDEEGNRSLQMNGLNLMDKEMCIQDARIVFRIWDVGGDNRSFDQVPIACKDAVAIFFMFDLTSKCTLNSIVRWFNEARKWNQTAIPILIGTKFDEFVEIPPNIQWTIIAEARAYARAMKATLFFSSATHNINVNKIFKFIMARLFNLPWTVHRNLTIGEPIIDY